MKNNWQTKKLGQICSVGAGNSAPQKKDFFTSGKYPFFRTSDIGRTHIGHISESSDCLNEKGIKGLKLFQKGTILIPKSGASTFLNHRVVMDIDGYVSSHLATIKTDEKILNNNFLFYFLQMIKAQDLIQDHKYPSLNLPVIENIEILLPDLDGQNRIVKILDSVFEKLEKVKQNTESNLQNSKDLFEIYLESIFINPNTTWKNKTLQDVCVIESKLVDPRRKGFLDLVHVGAGNIETRSEKLVDLKTSEEERLISGKFLFDNSMVLYSKIRPYLIKVVRPSFNGLCSADIYPLVPKREIITKDFLFFVLRSQAFTDYAIKGSARAGMPKVNRDHLFAYSFYLPSSEDQKSIVNKLDLLSEQTKKLESIYKKKLLAIEELKKSILHKAFGGEL